MDKFNFKKDILSKIKIIVLALILSIGISAVSAQWSDPNSAPPGGNPDLPLNTGLSPQIKKGGMAVGETLTPSDTGFVVISGRTGLGTSTPPTANLHAVGTARFESLPSAASNATRIIFSDTSGNLGYRSITIGGADWITNNPNDDDDWSTSNSSSKFMAQCKDGGCGGNFKDKNLNTETGVDWTFCALEAVLPGGFNSACMVQRRSDGWHLIAYDPGSDSTSNGGIYKNNTQRCSAGCIKF